MTAMGLRAVIGRFDRFRKGKQLSSYCGITPCNASSGKRQADAGLTNRGNEDLRAMLLQLAKRLPRRDGHWRELHQRLSRTKPANVVSAAIANRWLRRLFHEMVTIPKAQAGRPTSSQARQTGLIPLRLALASSWVREGRREGEANGVPTNHLLERMAMSNRSRRSRRPRGPALRG